MGAGDLKKDGHGMSMEWTWNDGNAQAHPLYDGNDGGDESRVMWLVDGGRAIY